MWNDLISIWQKFALQYHLLERLAIFKHNFLYLRIWIVCKRFSDEYWRTQDLGSVWFSVSLAHQESLLFIFSNVKEFRRFLSNCLLPFRQLLREALDPSLFLMKYRFPVLGRFVIKLWGSKWVRTYFVLCQIVRKSNRQSVLKTLE